MSTLWDGINQRSLKPGRRSSDLHGCPYHGDVHDDIRELQDHKLDKWIFTLFVSSVSVLLILAGTIFGYVAVEALNNSRHIAVVQVNQERLLRHFDIPPVQSAEVAKEILKNDEESE